MIFTDIDENIITNGSIEMLERVSRFKENELRLFKISIAFLFSVMNKNPNKYQMEIRFIPNRI
jgi:hypothetical protein